MKYCTIIVLFFTGMLVFSSCTHNLYFEKRRYLPGYHINYIQPEKHNDKMKYNSTIVTHRTGSIAIKQSEEKTGNDCALTVRPGRSETPEKKYSGPTGNLF